MIHNHPADGGSTRVGSGYGEKSHSVVLQRQPIENLRIVRGDKNLSRLRCIENPSTQLLKKRLCETGIQSVIRVIHGEEMRAVFVRREYCEEQNIKSAFTRIVAGETFRPSRM